jgi:hypothetical protein
VSTGQGVDSTQLSPFGAILGSGSIDVGLPVVGHRALAGVAILAANGTGSMVHLDLGAGGAQQVQSSAAPIDLGAAYDGASGSGLAAVATQGTAGPSITLLGLSASVFGSVDVVTAPALFSADHPPHPAVVATGTPGEFLVVWEGITATGDGAIYRTIAHCAAP